MKKNNSTQLQGKKLLVLGKSYSTVNVVKAAKLMGAYVVTTGTGDKGDATVYSDKDIEINTNDYKALTEYIKTNHIDGVMTGASEFNILNMIRLCSMVGLPVYATEEQWNLCQDKKNFKELCKKYHVPVVPEYKSAEDISEEDYPVIVKPIDGCSSRGITVCRTKAELVKAIEYAEGVSPSGQILIEKYIENGGITNMVKYVAVDGEYYLEAMGDRNVLDGGLVTALTIYPSRYLNLWIKKVDSYVREMLKGINLMNGVIAFQTIPDGDNTYIYECCLRITGGMTYKMTEAISGNSSMNMLLNYSLTGSMGDKNDISKIDPYFNGKYGSSLAIPLKTGTIGEIKGIEEIEEMGCVVDFTRYYKIGGQITPKCVNTLDQLFARIMVVGENKENIFKTLKRIRETLSVKNKDGENMIIWKTFDKVCQDYN